MSIKYYHHYHYHHGHLLSAVPYYYLKKMPIVVNFEATMTDSDEVEI